MLPNICIEHYTLDNTVSMNLSKPLVHIIIYQLLIEAYIFYLKKNLIAH